ncbi:uncharacterized protein LOC105843764 [Hydra vulgaris]|uniref:uncharacterized protein LOC105843764 n=1 Tax=Hydra vulgaris TaxID=6087 RepID=UPI001F5FBF4A|nr:uncharacterized protein LOC105843764 [Hydra vulgaris]XP_047146538.1 uncharacterized protein LOC105843764 [Hydra vulgaris]
MNLYKEHHEVGEKWLKKRKYTFIAFSMHMVVIGMEYSLTFITLWLYIKTMLNTNNPKLYYAFASVSFMVSSSLLTPFIGRVVDKRRNVNSCFLICNLLMFTGNLVYSFHFSPFFLIGGRLIAGVGASLRSVITSETIRSYPLSETSSKLSILSGMRNFGFVLAPGINFFFKDIKFDIGRWHLRDVNFPGLFLAFLCIVMEILTITMVYDVSKEFDLKAYAESNQAVTFNKIHDKAVKSDKYDEEQPIVKYRYSENKVDVLQDFRRHTVINILKVLFFHFDSALLMFANFFLAFFLFNADIWLPLLIIEKMQLSILEMNITVFGSSGFSAIILLLSMWRPFSDKKMIFLLIASLACFCIIGAGFIILTHFPNYKTLNIVLCIVYMISFGGAAIVFDVFFVNTLAKMVSSNVQTFVDSVRNSMFSAGAFLAFSCSPFMFDYVEIFGTFYDVIMVIIGIMFLVRKNQFIYPKLLL